MQKKATLIVVSLVVLGGLWYAFRPERLIVNQTVSESFPTASANSSASASQPVTLAAGNFHSVAHDSKGVATIYQLPDGKRTLRLTEFSTSNGPELMLYLVAANDATDSDMVKKAGFVTLGPLKGNQGDQNYDLPADLDLAKYRAVTVWCHRFGVNFGTAPLVRK
jgi:electron transfer DM13